MIVADLRGKPTITDLIEALKNRLLETHDPHEPVYAVSCGRDVDLYFGKPWIDNGYPHIMMHLYSEWEMEENIDEIQEEWEG